ncbi:aminopeptidase [uncultured Deinococcus sp.]|uniref:aminopeptidase n=1 Tax=uncultured Deinococcus sp. TaxID=158789 RepID=UPI00258F0FE9|nr:aminopeptidase [uncultured Deinococcus sp.]
MTGPGAYDPEQHARLMVEYCIDAQPGDRVLVACTTLALPLVEGIHRALLGRGAQPVLRLDYPGQQEDFLRLAPDHLLDHLHPADLADMESVQASIRILTPQRPRPGDPARQARHTRTAQPVAAARAQRRWTLTLYPTPDGAQMAGMALDEYERFVSSALFLDRPDPVAAWAAVRAQQADLIGRLSAAEEVRLVAPGTDLRLNIAGRQWVNSDGKRNMPSGEVFTGPHEDSAEGVIHYDLPTTFQGQRVRDIRLRFEGGRVVEAHAEEGDDALQAALQTDDGARYVGELGIGTNAGIQRPSMNILFDEKISGTVHLALGNSYPETGGTNRSALHWDMIRDLRPGGEILLDGRPFQRDGQFC